MSFEVEMLFQRNLKSQTGFRPGFHIRNDFPADVAESEKTPELEMSFKTDSMSQKDCSNYTLFFELNLQIETGCLN